MATLQLCKLTTQNLTTHNGFQWTLGEPAPVLSGDGGLCSSTVYHCYEHPLLAVLLNPIHANIPDPRLFAVEIPAPYDAEPVLDNGLVIGYRTMRITHELPLPAVTSEIRAEFARLCVRGAEKSEDIIFGEAIHTAATYAAAYAVYGMLTKDMRAAYGEAYATKLAAETAKNAARSAPLNLIELAEKAFAIAEPTT